MMIPTIGDLLYRVHHEKQYWLTREEKRRAVSYIIAILILITISILCWMVAP